MKEQDFEEMLRKAFEKGLDLENTGDTDGDEEETDFSSADFSKLVDKLGVAAIVHIGTAARKKIIDIIKNLKKDLEEIDDVNNVKYMTVASSKVRTAGKELNALHSIITASCMCTMAIQSGNDIDSAIDIAMKMVTM